MGNPANHLVEHASNFVVFASDAGQEGGSGRDGEEREACWEQEVDDALGRRPLLALGGERECEQGQVRGQHSQRLGAVLQSVVQAHAGRQQEQRLVRQRLNTQAVQY